MSERVAPHDLARFWSKVDRRGDGECWPWKRSLVRGYGSFWWAGKTRRAYRFAYEVTVGAVPSGMVLDHVCANRLCCNPAHLRACSHKENILAPWSAALARLNAERTECRKGHPLSGPTLKIDARGARICMVCRRRNDLRRYHERRAAKRLEAANA